MFQQGNLKCILRYRCIQGLLLLFWDDGLPDFGGAVTIFWEWEGVILGCG